MTVDPIHAHVYLDKQHRDVYRAQVRVAMAVKAAAEEAGFSRILVELINIRVSQLNGCGSCLDVHVHDALAAGETSQRLGVLPAWRDVGLFTDRERAALAVAEAVTLLPDPEERDRVLGAARVELGDDGVSVAAWLAINMNAFNRISITSHHPVRRREA